ncbi:MAG: Molybdopterin synthase sulfur carrier subunit [Pseudomonadota bacterium]|jgi:molybdopterin synthase sulfur carrier subunit
MQIQMRYFAAIREALGTGAETWQTEARTAGALLAELRQRSPAHAQALAEGRALRLAVQQVMAGPDTLLVDGAEVGVFPPVTGG